MGTFGHKPILVIVSALFDRCCEVVALMLVIIIHAVAQREVVAEQVASDIDCSIKERPFSP